MRLEVLRRGTCWKRQQPGSTQGAGFNLPGLRLSVSPLPRVIQAAPPSGCSEQQPQSFILMSLLSRVMTRTSQETRSFSVKTRFLGLGPEGLLLSFLLSPGLLLVGGDRETSAGRMILP